MPYHNQCDKAGCTCIPTKGKTCICVCKDENGDITRCDDCKCTNSDTCKCKCDGSKCTCIVTKRADVICVNHDGRGDIKACNCSCADPENKRCCELKASAKPCGCCGKKPEKNNGCENCKCDKINQMRQDEGQHCCCIDVNDGKCCNKELSFKSCKCCKEKPKKKACGNNCMCEEKREHKESRNVVLAYKNHKCDKAGCFFIPTGGKCCICVCENEDGDIIRCDNCKCLKSHTCQRKCDDSRCTCIITKGADIICIRSDRRGNIMVCDCCSIEANNVKCSKKEVSVESCECCTKKFEKQSCCDDYKCGQMKSVKTIRRDDEKRDVKGRSYCCDEADKAKCCGKEITFNSCECCKEPEKKSCNYRAIDRE